MGGSWYWRTWSGRMDSAAFTTQRWQILMSHILIIASVCVEARGMDYGQKSQVYHPSCPAAGEYGDGAISFYLLNLAVEWHI